MTEGNTLIFDLGKIVCAHCGRKMTNSDVVVYSTSYSLADGIRQSAWHKRCPPKEKKE